MLRVLIALDSSEVADQTLGLPRSCWRDDGPAPDPAPRGVMAGKLQ